MAKNYDTLKTQAETIRTNVLPESNTAGLVGQMFKDLVDRVESTDTAITERAASAAAAAEAAAGTANTAIAAANEAKTAAKSASDAADTAATNSSSALTKADAANNTSQKVKNDFETLVDNIGFPEGLTPLNESGNVDVGYLPPCAFDVLPFKKSVTGVSIENGSSNKSSTDDDCYVVFEPANKRFLLYVAAYSGSLISTAKYYMNWLDRKLYYDDNNISRRKLFLNQSSGKLYYFDGTDLKPIDARLQLGKTSEDAYPGAEGTKLEQRIDAAEKALAGLKIPKLVALTEAAYAQLSKKDENTYYMLTEE
jgi:hypothetical protein